MSAINAGLGCAYAAANRFSDALDAFTAATADGVYQLTADQFAGPRDDVSAINAGLGCAYAAANRFSDALDAFTAATADGVYQLTADQSAARDRAHDALSASAAMMPATDGVYQLTADQAAARDRAHDALSASAAMMPATDAFDTAVDPLDPLGQSGNFMPDPSDTDFMPDPSDTGFFTLSEHEMVQQDRAEAKVRRKHRHLGLKIFITILLILVVAGGGLAFAYTRGFGFPTQQDTLTKLFEAASSDAATDEFLASGLDDSQRAVIVASIPKDATATIEGMDAGMSESRLPPPMPQPMSSWPPASTIASVRSSWPPSPRTPPRPSRAWTPA